MRDVYFGRKTQHTRLPHRAYSSSITSPTYKSPTSRNNVFMNGAFLVDQMSKFSKSANTLAPSHRTFPVMSAQSGGYNNGSYNLNSLYGQRYNGLLHCPVQLSSLHQNRGYLRDVGVSRPSNMQYEVSHSTPPNQFSSYNNNIITAYHQSNNNNPAYFLQNKYIDNSNSISSSVSHYYPDTKTLNEPQTSVYSYSTYAPSSSSLLSKQPTFTTACNDVSEQNSSLLLKSSTYDRSSTDYIDSSKFLCKRPKSVPPAHVRYDTTNTCTADEEITKKKTIYSEKKITDAKIVKNATTTSNKLTNDYKNSSNKLSENSAKNTKIKKSRKEVTPDDNEEIISSNENTSVNGARGKRITEGEVRAVMKLNQTNQCTGETGFREIQIIAIHENPDIYVMPDFLTKDECDRLIKLSEGRWHRSKTSMGKMATSVDEYESGESPSRTSNSAFLKHKETTLVETIENRVAAVAQMPVSHVESLVVVKYDEGQYFKEHHDGDFRTATILIYLNDVEEGGETDFPYVGMKIVPERGTAVYWKNVDRNGDADTRLFHSGLAPIKGQKYAVNCFINKDPVRQETKTVMIEEKQLSSSLLSSTNETSVTPFSSNLQNYPPSTAPVLRTLNATTPTPASRSKQFSSYPYVTPPPAFPPSSPQYVSTQGNCVYSNIHLPQGSNHFGSMLKSPANFRNETPQYYLPRLPASSPTLVTPRYANSYSHSFNSNKPPLYSSFPMSTKHIMPIQPYICNA